MNAMTPAFSPARPASDAESAAIAASMVPAKPDPIPASHTLTAHARLDGPSLTAAINACIRIVEKRNAAPMFANVMLTASAGGVTMEGTDGDIVITVPINGTADANFATTIPAHMLRDVLRKAKGCEMVTVDLTEKTTYRAPYGYEKTLDPVPTVDNRNSLRMGRFKVTLNGLPAADFPKLKPESRQFSHKFTMPAADLARALSKVEFCISTEETRYYLNGIYMHVPHHSKARPATLCFAATDGHRMGVADIPAPDGVFGMPGVIVPAKAVAEFIRLCSAKPVAEHYVTISVSPARVQLQAGDVTVNSYVIDGTYPDYGRVVPSGNDKLARVDIADLIDAVDKVCVISSERGRTVKLAFTAGNCLLTVVNPDTGAATLPIDLEYSSNPMDIGFNSRYLTSILEMFDGDVVEMLMADPGSPTLFTGRDTKDSGVRYVLMPMRV